MTDNNAKFRILFVDDEENILRGLARMLRGRRDVWDMHFATSGEAALNLMSKERFDVIVSDMRMPTMDGAELLALVQKLYPRTVRIILSGFADREAVLKTIGPSHRYLAKRCPEHVLVDSIAHSTKLRRLLQDEALQQNITSLSYIPTLPAAYQEILQELSSELASADSLARKIERDVGISAQLLKLTNSAYFAMPHPCSSIKQAVNFLGFENVRMTVLLAGVFDQIRNIPDELMRQLERLTRRSLGIGLLAQLIAKHNKQPIEISNQAFCAGILSHIGTIVLVANRPEAYLNAMAKLDTTPANLVEVEQATFGTTHASIGAYILGLWGFSDPIVEAVAYHHSPSSYTLTDFPVLLSLHLAQHFAKGEKANVEDALDYAYLEAAGALERIPEWQTLSLNVVNSWPAE